ncbi:MAG: PIN domain nuclease [Peptococcaceae bacterium]|nr:PIN domain nuclease [Peptococcaceae bacterium]
MILVDTSVLIDFFKGKADDKIKLFQKILTQDIPFGISCYTYQEILQGAKDEKDAMAVHMPELRILQSLA